MVEKANKKLFKDEEPNIKIGATLKIKRKEQNKTLHDVSEKAGVSKSFISKLENDQIKANLGHIKGILDDLNIKEEVFQVSQDMNRWYEDLLDYQLDLSDGKLSFKELTDQRDDFQSKIIELAIDIKKGKYGNSEKYITLLINAIDTMKPIEVAIFLLIVTEYYFQINDLFKAADLISIVLKKEFVHVKVDLWLHELMFRLSLCSKNEHYVTKIFLKLQEMYIFFNLYGKSTETRMAYIQHCAYIKDESFFKKLISFDDAFPHVQSQLMNYFLNDKFSKMKTILDQYPVNPSFDCLRALYLHRTQQLDSIEPLIQQLTFHEYDAPIETFFKGYLKALYIEKQPEKYLKVVLGNKSDVFYHTGIIELASNYYIEYLTHHHRYKECTQIMKMINSRLDDIQKNLEVF